MMQRASRIHVWRVHGLDCPTCAEELERDIRASAGVEAAELDFMGGMLRVHCGKESCTSGQECHALLRDLGETHGVEFEQLSQIPPETTEGTPVIEPPVPEPSRPASFPLEAQIMLASGAFLSLGWGFQSVIGYGLSMIVAGNPVARKARHELANRHLGMNTLMIAAAVGAAFIGEWQEGAMVLFLFTIARWLERLSTEHARNAIDALKQRLPARVHLVRSDGPDEDLPVETVRVGQMVRIKPGERVPVDGVIRRGSSTIDESVMTGESEPAVRRPGDKVLAGTMNLDGSFIAEVEQAAERTLFSRIMVSVESAQREKSRIQGTLERFAAWYTPVVFFAAVCVAFLPPLVETIPGWSRWFYNALVLLVVSCPCALVLAAPVTQVAAMAALAKRGILLRNGDRLETAGEIRTCAFDKTGTLTRGEPRLVDWVCHGPLSPAAALSLAVSLEIGSEHPLARAFSARAETDGIPVPSCENLISHRGLGIEGSVAGQRYRLGREDWILSLLPGRQSAPLNLSEPGRTTVLLADETQPLATFILGDSIREEAMAALSELPELGVVHRVLLSGDREETVRECAQRLGIEEAHGRLSPERKLEEVRRLRATRGPVLMIGDGVNDTPALAAADLGVAMGGRGVDAALQTADAVLLHDDLSRLPLLLKTAQRARRIIHQNIFLAVGLKLVVFLLALTGHATLWMAVVADTGASVLVVANGLRALREPS